VSDDKPPCRFCRAAEMGVYTLGGCRCAFLRARAAQPPVALPPVVEMARIAAPVDADGRPCEEP
jgi:hypothetical protein